MAMYSSIGVTTSFITNNIMGHLLFNYDKANQYFIKAYIINYFYDAYYFCYYIFIIIIYIITSS